MPTPRSDEPETRSPLADQLADMLGALAISTATIAVLWLPAMIGG